MRALFRNTEIKRFTIGFIVLQAIIIAVFLMIFSIKANELKRIYINHNIAVAGKILEVNPELEKDIVGYFTKGVDKRDIETGTKILSKYGYTDKAELIQDSLVYSIFSKTGLQFCLYIVLFAGIVYLFSIIEFKNVFNRINTMSSAADEIIKGNYNVEISDFCEGDMYILGHQLNEITKIIKNNIDVLKKEKTFLKNIISDISHQLKTPLSSLIMFNELLLDDVIETEVDKKAIIVQSHDQLNRMEWLIVNLLKLARIESGTIEFNMNNSPVSTTIEKALAPLKLKAEEKNQKISIICNTNILLRHDFGIIKEENKLYYMDVYDHLLRIFDLIDTYQDLLAGTLDLYMSQISNRMNEIMKVLTIITTLMMPMTVISGIYGMNFQFMPGLQSKAGFGAAIILMLVIMSIEVIYFKIKKWL